MRRGMAVDDGDRVSCGRFLLSSDEWLGTLLVLGLAWCLLGCETRPAAVRLGTVSWYSRASTMREGNSGVMANGQVLQDAAFTCASWDYPFGTTLQITGSSGRTVRCVVADHGPARYLYRQGRVLDLSLACFQALAPLLQGLVEVEITPL